MELASPSGNNTVVFKLDEQGRPTYSVNHDQQAVILESGLGFELVDGPAMLNGFEILGSSTEDKEEREDCSCLLLFLLLKQTPQEEKCS